MTDDNGDPWFVAKDVGKAMALSNTAKAVAGLDDDERGVTTFHTPSGMQEMTIINESGLYSLILRSRKPEAKAFKKWVTAEVLPSIRKKGGYMVAAQNKELGIYEGHVIKIDDGMLNLTNMWKACGGKKQKPAEWLRHDEAVDMMAAVKRNPKYASDAHFDSKRGNGGGTYVHRIVGLAYAKYLSPDFHIWCNERLLESGLIEVSDGELLVKLGEDGMPVESIGWPKEAQEAIRQLAENNKMKKNCPAIIRHEEVEVLGAPILVAIDENEEKFFSPKHVCEAIGVGWSPQLNKIMKDQTLSGLVDDIIIQVPGDDQRRHIFMLPIDKLSGWLFMINPNKVKPEVKPMLLKYRAEAFAVLDAWFRKNARAASTAST